MTLVRERSYQNQPPTELFSELWVKVKRSYRRPHLLVNSEEAYAAAFSLVLSILLFVSQPNASRAEPTIPPRTCELTNSEGNLFNAARAAARLNILVKEEGLFDQVLWRFRRDSMRLIASAYLEDGRPVIEISGLLVQLACALDRDIATVQLLGVNKEKQQALLAEAGWNTCIENPTLSNCPITQSGLLSLADSGLRSKARERLSNPYFQEMTGRAFLGALKFIILHEFGHHILGHTHLSSMPNEIRTTHEEEADFFAITRTLPDWSISILGLVNFLYYYERLERRLAAGPLQYDLSICREFWAVRTAYASQMLMQVIGQVTKSADVGRQPDPNLIALLSLDRIPRDPLPDGCISGTTYEKQTATYVDDVKSLSGYIETVLKLYFSGNYSDLLQSIAKRRRLVRSPAGKIEKAIFDASVTRLILASKSALPNAVLGSAIAEMEAQLPELNVQGAASVLETLALHDAFVDRSTPSDVRLQRAGERLIAVTEHDPYRLGALGCLGLIFASKGFFDEAIEVISHAITVAEGESIKRPLELYLTLLRSNPTQARRAANRQLGVE